MRKNDRGSRQTGVSGGLARLRNYGSLGRCKGIAKRRDYT